MVCVSFQSSLFIIIQHLIINRSHFDCQIHRGVKYYCYADIIFQFSKKSVKALVSKDELLYNQAVV